ncbi:MAG TPA: DNA recombination protein RmuC [Candidatus Brocadiales bacterium]|nr:DNA recombination protein RmuC [Candidatus Brocadiales bacterium]
MEYLVIALLAVVVGLVLWSSLRPKGDGQSLLLMQQHLLSLQEQIRSSLNGSTQQTNQSILLMHQQIDALRNRVGESLDGGSQLINRVVGDVRVHLAQLEESNKKLYEVGKDISGLQDILRAPKMRGGLGELFLGDLLAQILPAEHFTLQHTFRTGERVDAVIRLGQGLVSVDAKFPLENFKKLIDAKDENEKRAFRKQFVKDVKTHIDTIAQKYILPDEGTFEFALMYIPAENVYYEIIIKDATPGEERSISDYAISKRVIPVSPNSFYAYLQSILLGLKGMRIERSALEIIRNLTRLNDDFSRFSKEFDTLGTHLSNAKAKYESAEKCLDKYGSKLAQVESVELPQILEGPKVT